MELQGYVALKKKEDRIAVNLSPPTSMSGGLTNISGEINCDRTAVTITKTDESGAANIA